MKKLLVISMIVLFVVSSVFANGVIEHFENEKLNAAPIEGVKEVVVLNNAFDGLSMSNQVYNAKEYHKSYSLAEIVKDNFWFQPEADTEAVTVAYTDFYEDKDTAASFMKKYVSLARDNEKYDYDLFVGQNQKESYDVKYKGFVRVGAEALIFVLEDGWMVSELMEILPFAAAETYDLVTVDGSVYRVSAEEIADFEILPEGDGYIVTNGDITIADPEYLIPTGLTPESQVESGVVSKATVIYNAKGVYGVEPKYSENRAGTVYKSWMCADLLAKFSVPVEGDVVITSYKDGFTKTISASEFASLAIAFQAPTSKGDQKDYFTLGKNQERNAGVTNVGSYVFDTAAFVYIPDGGLALSDVAIAERSWYKLTDTDGLQTFVTRDELMSTVLSSDSKTVTIEAI